MREIGFGIIGMGAIARIHMSAIESIPGARVVAISDVVEERARQVGDEKSISWYRDYTDMLKNSDVDVVCVCTPSGLRGKICMDAAQAGKHIISEKPLEVSLEKIDAIIRECDLAGVKLAAIFQNRFMNDIRVLKDAVDSGRLGRLVMGDAYIKWHRSQDYYDSAGWRGTWAMDGGGALMNQAIHYVDLLQWIMGPVESVFALTATLVHKIEVEDSAVACIKFKNGAMGVIEACTCAYPGTSARLDIRGDRGTIIIEDGNVKLWSIDGEESHTPAVVNQGSGASDPMAIGALGHQIQIKDMVSAINEGRPPAVEGREARKAVELILAIYESSRTRKEVCLPV